MIHLDPSPERTLPFLGACLSVLTDSHALWNAGHLSASCRLSFFLFTDLSENTVCPAGCDTRSHYCPHRAWCWSVLALRQENRWDGEGVSNNSSNSWNLSLSMSSPYLEMHPSLYGVILFCIVLIRLEGLNRKKGKK